MKQIYKIFSLYNDSVEKSKLFFKEVYPELDEPTKKEVDTLVSSINDWQNEFNSLTDEQLNSEKYKSEKYITETIKKLEENSNEITATMDKCLSFHTEDK